MGYLPTEDEMSSLQIEARIRKILGDNKDEFEKGLVSGLVDGFEAYRISSDGKIKFLTRQEYEELWQNSQTSGESSEK